MMAPDECPMKRFPRTSLIVVVILAIIIVARWLGWIGW
jgi:hypothetical protein